jgi:hypothetical protein
MSFFLMPGTWVLLPSAPDWGLGQVQSATGYRVTVNFEHAGKVLVNTAKATLQVLEDHELDAYLAQQQAKPPGDDES